MLLHCSQEWKQTPVLGSFLSVLKKPYPELYLLLKLVKARTKRSPEIHAQKYTISIALSPTDCHWNTPTERESSWLWTYQQACRALDTRMKSQRSQEPLQKHIFEVELLFVHHFMLFLSLHSNVIQAQVCICSYWGQVSKWKLFKVK